MNSQNKTANSAWLELVDALLKNGASDISPRGMNTREFIGARSVFDMNFPVVTNLARKISYRFMLAEATWILSGSNKVEDIAPYNRRMADFSDDGKTLAGAYGPRVVAQLLYVASKLVQDPMTRQAVMTIWKINPIPSKDIPCTIGSQFLIRDEQLHVIQTMRSSDVWLGWPYDVFSFTMIATWLCIWLRQQGMKNLTLGSFVLSAGSQHLYETNVGEAVKCICKTQDALVYKPINLAEFEDPEDLIEHLICLRNRNFTATDKTFLMELKDVSTNKS